MSQENNDIIEQSGHEKGENFFRNPRDKVKFGIEIAVMVIVGFLCIYPLALFLGNILR